VSIDISGLNLAELTELQNNIRIALSQRKSAAKNRLIDDIKAIAKNSGFSLEELLGSAQPGPKRVRTTTAAKFRSPHDHSQTWSGRGRRPHWIIALLATGQNLDSLAI